MSLSIKRPYLRLSILSEMDQEQNHDHGRSCHTNEGLSATEGHLTIEETPSLNGQSIQ